MSAGSFSITSAGGAGAKMLRSDLVPGVRRESCLMAVTSFLCLDAPQQRRQHHGQHRGADPEGDRGAKVVVLDLRGDGLSLFVEFGDGFESDPALDEAAAD